MSKRQQFQAPLLVNRVQSAQGGARQKRKIMKDSTQETPGFGNRSNSINLQDYNDGLFYRN